MTCAIYVGWFTKRLPGKHLASYYDTGKYDKDQESYMLRVMAIESYQVSEVDGSYPVSALLR